MCKDRANNDRTVAVKFLQMNAKGNEVKSIVNEINILKESVECPYVVEYVIFIKIIFIGNVTV